MNSKGYAKPEIKVADELFVAVALLEREHPEKDSFSVREILERAEKENINGGSQQRPGLKVHAYGHAVANLPPHGGKYRILYKTSNGNLRLLRAGDDVHPERTQKIWPAPDELPAKYSELIDWAKQRYRAKPAATTRWLEGIFQLRGFGKKLWAGEDPDEYVNKLREKW
ncbi:MAG TPA: hypothetical protein VN670_00735 [Acidobacteriaceae bacterium]|nr:hypothetical protein [Acidobacteriaceae bacterium]